MAEGSPSPMCIEATHGWRLNGPARVLARDRRRGRLAPAGRQLRRPGTRASPMIASARRASTSSSLPSGRSGRASSSRRPAPPARRRIDTASKPSASAIAIAVCAICSRVYAGRRLPGAGRAKIGPSARRREAWRDDRVRSSRQGASASTEHSRQLATRGPFRTPGPRPRHARWASTSTRRGHSSSGSGDPDLFNVAIRFEVFAGRGRPISSTLVPYFGDDAAVGYRPEQRREVLPPADRRGPRTQHSRKPGEPAGSDLRVRRQTRSRRAQPGRGSGQTSCHAHGQRHSVPRRCPRSGA